MLKLENVSKYYYSKFAVTLGLRKINLTFNKGEFVAITGESGSGKSTLLNIICGMDTYEDGEIFVNGEPTSYFDAKDWEAYRRDYISFIYQNYNLIDSYSVLDNVMSALLVQGYPQQEAKITALELIEKVGLTNRMNNRATKLSSGQKQRLAIARALARNTDIIVADEPTGNLDAENGEQIIKLLHELSKDKLVLIVTHNYEQVQEFVTRKIKLFDGEVVEDKKIRKAEKPEPKEAASRKKLSDFKTALHFNSLNLRAQPKRCLTIFSFILILTLASFILLGTLIINFDFSRVRRYDDSAFKNGNDRRLVVKRQNGGELAESDYAEILSLNNVVSVERDSYSDINYFLTSDCIESFVTSNQTGVGGDIVSYSIMIPQDYSHFIMTSRSLEKKTLLSGRLPSGNYEVVVSSEHAALVGKSVTIFFRITSTWGVDVYYSCNFDVVGVVDSKDNQIYFNEEFSIDLSRSSDRVFLDLYFKYTRNGLVNSEVIKKLVLVLNKDLPENTFRISDREYNERLIDREIMNYNIGTKDLAIFSVNSEDPHTKSSRVLEVSSNVFDAFYSDIAHTQATVYIDDYSNSDLVIAALNKIGYRAVSPYRVGSVEIVPEKMTEAILTICFSAGVLLALYGLGIVVMKAIMKTKKNDYVILKSLGMTNKTVWLINYMEVAVYSVASIILTCVAVMFIPLNATGFLGMVGNIAKYYHFWQLLIFIVANLLEGFLLAQSFNKYLEKKVNITVLGEE